MKASLAQSFLLYFKCHLLFYYFLMMGGPNWIVNYILHIMANLFRIKWIFIILLIDVTYVFIPYYLNICSTNCIHIKYVVHYSIIDVKYVTVMWDIIQPKANACDVSFLLKSSNTIKKITTTMRTTFCGQKKDHFSSQRQKSSIHE